jgi:hypothetical protein
MPTFNLVEKKIHMGMQLQGMPLHIFFLIAHKLDIKLDDRELN